MAEATAVNGDAVVKANRRQALLSNLTKRRVSELHQIRDQLVIQDLAPSQKEQLLDVLFQTYPLYVDFQSRQAVEQCLTAILRESGNHGMVYSFVNTLIQEAKKTSIAPGNAFVLVRWTSLIIQGSAQKKSQWDTWGKQVVLALTDALHTLLGSEPKASTRATGLRVSRRAIRALTQSKFGDEAIRECISTLAAKAASPTAKHAITLGIVAAVCKRDSHFFGLVETLKADYFTFYMREVLGSRVKLPTHVANGLRDFFGAFVSLDDLRTEIIPGIEKALLRAPEVVLDDLLTPLISSLPTEMELADTVASKLLKPLLSNIKSSNLAVRVGAVRAFEETASRCRDTKGIESIADEIVNPLKTNKVTAADQRVLYAQMLTALPPTNGTAVKAPLSLAPVAAKEANESAAAALSSVIANYSSFALKEQLRMEPTVIEAFAKGIAEKRLPMRRLWALRLAGIYWALDRGTFSAQASCALLDPCIGKLVDVFNEVSANPLPAVQGGQISVACSTAALFLSKVPTVPELKNLSVIKKAGIAKKVLALEPKPSFLLNPRVYTKLTAEEDITWNVRALEAVFTHMSTQPHDFTALAWSQNLIYCIVGAAVPIRVKHQALQTLRRLYLSRPEEIGRIIVDGLAQWCKDVESDAKESAAISSRTGREELFKVIRAICLDADASSNQEPSVPEEVVVDQLIDMLVLGRPQLVPRTSWIDLCLRSGNDPGSLVAKNAERCLAQVLSVTETPELKAIPAFQSAAFGAAAELAFIAPETMTALIVAQIGRDLDPYQLHDIGPTEAAIYRTPEGTAFIDVLSKQAQTQQMSKNSKDYDTLQWEEELRAQLAQKKGQTKKLTSEEQAKVNAQLAKESAIRKQVSEIDGRFRRGVGIISALTTGPPTEAEEWFGPSVQSLFEVIQAGAGLTLGSTAALSYLQCSERTSARLGPMRPFVGVATLRSTGVTMLPENLLAEPLGDLVTRVLYRLRFLGEQRPFDTITLSYVLPLIFLVIENGGVDQKEAEDSDEQIVLAIEFLSFHTDTCSDSRLPRQKVLATLINAMESFTQHFRLIKDCFADLCRALAPSMIERETDTVVRGAISPDPSVRGVVLQTISAELDLEDRDFYEEIWVACHDDVDEHREVARDIWEENGLTVSLDGAAKCLHFLESKDAQLRRAAARSITEAIDAHPAKFAELLQRLEETYIELAKPRKPELDRYGMPIRKDLTDPWEVRHGVSLALKELSAVFDERALVSFFHFLVEKGPLADKNASVRDSMVEAAVAVATAKGKSQVEPLMMFCEQTLESFSASSQTQDLVNEAIVIVYGALARHLPHGDGRIPKVIQKLLSTLSTPSESVQYAVSQCLPPLVQASPEQSTHYLTQVTEETMHAKKYAARRGAAYGLAAIVKGKGIAILREARLLSTLKGATENKKDVNERQGAFLAYELLSLLLGRVFEPYVIQVVPQLLSGFGDSSADVREACLDASKTCFASLSSFGVKQVLPTLLEGLDEQQWRSKKGACDSLGAMAYLDPQQLAVSLPEIIPPLTEVLNDSHKEVRASANRSLQRFGEVISNPEVKSQVNILLKALSDPTKYTDDALDALIKVNFIHYLDAPSLALVVRILERGLGDRSATKRKAAQIIGSLAHLTERRDLISHLPILVAGLRAAIVDPVPTTRATASKALGSTIEKLGEDALPDLIPNLMATLKSDSGAGDRLGSAQALSEVLAGLGTSRLEETLPTILQNVQSSKASVREGFMSLFIFLPACFGNSFANYLAKVIPPILSGLADDVEAIRETALRAGRLLVKNFASKSIDLLLPELERGLADDSHRIRLSSVELVGDLLFNLTGISGKTEAEDAEDGANEAGQSLLEVLGEERRNKVLSALYICRNDTSGLVRSAAINVWKALVSSPRTLRELIPTLTQFLIRRLASSNMEQKVIAGNALGELIRKAGEGVLSTLLPTLEEGLETSTDADARQGICIALRELISSASFESLEEYEKTLISVVRTALTDQDDDVREAAAEAFDSLQKIIGKRAVDQVLPHLLNLLRSEEEAEHALSALLTLLTETTRSNIILPTLLPTLLTSPISAFNAKALASLAEVASSAMTRRLPNILNALMDNTVVCKDETLKADLDSAFDTIILSVDEFDGLNAMMSVMLNLVKNDDHRKRASADRHLGKFFELSELDFARYHPDLIRALLIAFDDGDAEVVKAAWTALSALTQRLRKEELESLVGSTRQTLNQVGVPGHNLPGFSLPKGIGAVLPIFLQGLMNGSAEQRTQAALAISDLIDRTSAEGLRPFVTQITGPLIRVVSERSTELKAAILLTLNNLLEKVPTFLKPFLPQLQRTFAKSLADPSSEVLRSRAARALGTLITMTPRIDPLIAELVTGSKTTDAGVRNAMLKALYEVVSKAGGNMSDVSRNSILGLIDSDASANDEATNITHARLQGALIKVLPPDAATGLIKSRVLTNHFTSASVLALNAVLVESPESVTGALGAITPQIIVQGIRHNNPFIADNCVLAAGKWLLARQGDKSFEATKAVLEALAAVMVPGAAVDTRRLALVVVRTVSREEGELVRPQLGSLAPAVFSGVRDPVIPVKLAAEAAFLALFAVVDEESAVFDKYMAGAGAELAAGPKRSMQEYFKRIALRLSGQARERREAEGGAGGLGLSNDEKEDEREVWSVGKVDLGEGVDFSA